MGALGFVLAAECEANYYREQNAQTDPKAWALSRISLLDTEGDSP